MLFTIDAGTVRFDEVLSDLLAELRLMGGDQAVAETQNDRVASLGCALTAFRSPATAW